jgi:cysteinyl-tRNA synthetase
MLKIYNSLAREKQDFVPITPGSVRMYVCGMTVYDYCHLGHARVLVVFDMVQRWLRASGLQVTYVRNITDIDDKIIKRALGKQRKHRRTDRALHRFMDEDAQRWGWKSRTMNRAPPSYVPQMLALIGQLEKNGLAYQAAAAT